MLLSAQAWNTICTHGVHNNPIVPIALHAPTALERLCATGGFLWLIMP